MIVKIFLKKKITKKFNDLNLSNQKQNKFLNASNKLLIKKDN